MYSKHHAAISIAVAALAVLPMAIEPPMAVGLVAYAGVIGVAIDLDHFVIARLNAGDWRALRACLREPTIAVFDQSRIFEEGELSALQRLLSHHLIAATVVAGFATVSIDVALVSAIVLYAHVLSDLAWDVYRERARSNRSD